jgi:ASC-1-like (ASCH) protein
MARKSFNEKLNDSKDMPKIIKVTDEKLLVDVLKLHIFDNFKDLYKHFSKVSLGYKENEIANPEDMNIYYSKDEQDKYGVVGIEIKKR